MTPSAARVEEETSSPHRPHPTRWTRPSRSDCRCAAGLCGPARRRDGSRARRSRVAQGERWWPMAVASTSSSRPILRSHGCGSTWCAASSPRRAGLAPHRWHARRRPTPRPIWSLDCASLAPTLPGARASVARGATCPERRRRAARAPWPAVRSRPVTTRRAGTSTAPLGESLRPGRGFGAADRRVRRRPSRQAADAPRSCASSRRSASGFEIRRKRTCSRSCSTFAAQTASRGWRSSCCETTRSSGMVGQAPAVRIGGAARDLLAAQRAARAAGARRCRKRAPASW